MDFKQGYSVVVNHPEKGKPSRLNILLLFKFSLDNEELKDV